MKTLLKKSLLVSLAGIISVITVQVASAQTFAENALKRKAENLSGDRFTIFTATRKGARVFAYRKPKNEILTAIDRGLDDLFEAARKHGYNSRLRHSDYVIFIAKPDRMTDSDGNYIPNFAIPVAQYAGTDYDKGGFMYAAGMVIGYNPAAFMIAENEKKLEQVSEVVRFEGEHLILYHNDRRRYNETADHSRGGGHPILN
jgi:hypothetical protein